MLKNALTVLLVALVAGAGLLPFSTEPRANDAAALDGPAVPALVADAESPDAEARD